MPSLDEAHRRERFDFTSPEYRYIAEGASHNMLADLEKLDTTIQTLVFSLILLCPTMPCWLQRDRQNSSKCSVHEHIVCVVYGDWISPNIIFTAPKIFAELYPVEKVLTKKWSILVVEPASSVLNRSLYQMIVFLQRFCRWKV